MPRGAPYDAMASASRCSRGKEGEKNCQNSERRQAVLDLMQDEERRKDRKDA